MIAGQVGNPWPKPGSTKPGNSDRFRK